MLKRSLMLVMALVAPMVLAACGGDEKGPVLAPHPGPTPGTPVPREMVGLWEMTLTLSDCTGAEGITVTDTLSICPDDYVEGGDDPANCSVEQSGNTVSADCTESYDEAGCRVTQRTRSSSTVTANEFSFFAESRTTYGESCGLGSWCIRIEGSGHKIGPAPNPCNSDNEIQLRADAAVHGGDTSRPEIAEAWAIEMARDAMLRH